MCYGKKILSAILATALILSLVACGGNHVEAPDETGDYTVNYHESVALPSINAEIEFTDFSIENLADDGAGDLNFYITLHLPDAADPASYAAWFSNFSAGNNEADYELVTIGDDGTGAYVQISEELDASFDTMIYHVFCTADLSGGSLSLTGSVNNDLNFEFEISENEVSSFLFEQAENLFENEQYDSSLTYYKFVSGAQKEKADSRMQSIECLDVIDSLNATIEGSYNTTDDFWGQYMNSFFNTSVTATGSFDIQDYTYTLRIAFSSIFSNIAALTGSSLGDAIGNSGGMQGTYAKDTYEVFYKAGFDGITCRVEFSDYEGNVFETDTYTLTDHENDINTEIREKEEAEAKTADVIERYTLITGEDLYPNSGNVANPEYNGKLIRMENLEINSSIENTDGSMDCDMVLWLNSVGINIIRIEINDPYAVRRINDENLEYVNIYGVVNIEPNQFNPEISSVTILDGGVYFLEGNVTETDTYTEEKYDQEAQTQQDEPATPTEDGFTVPPVNVNTDPDQNPYDIVDAPTITAEDISMFNQNRDAYLNGWYCITGLEFPSSQNSYLYNSQELYSVDNVSEAMVYFYNESEYNHLQDTNNPVTVLGYLQSSGYGWFYIYNAVLIQITPSESHSSITPVANISANKRPKNV